MQTTKNNPKKVLQILDKSNVSVTLINTVICFLFFFNIVVFVVVVVFLFFFSFEFSIFGRV